MGSFWIPAVLVQSVKQWKQNRYPHEKRKRGLMED
jgi:hypothetical protein